MSDNSYINWVSMTDTALMESIGKFVQHHRLAQNKTQSEVAKSAGISRSTLSLMERGEGVALKSLILVLRVLDLLYIMDTFRVKNEISPLAYAKLKKNQKQRARKKGDSFTNEKDLGW